MGLRHRVKSIARIALAAVLFVQAALATAACALPERAAAQAIAGAAEPKCHEEGSVPANLCVAHCTEGFQSLDKPSLAVPAAIDAPVLVVATARQPSVHLGIPRERPKPTAGPPHRILLHSFLI